MAEIFGRLYWFNYTKILSLLSETKRTRGMCTYFSIDGSIDFHIKIGESSFNWHPTSYICIVIKSCEPTSFKSISLWANEWLIYHSASWEVTSLQILSQQPYELRTCITRLPVNQSIFKYNIWKDTPNFLHILYSGIFMKLMSKILVIFMFLPDINSVFISLNSIVTLDSIQGSAVL